MSETVELNYAEAGSGPPVVFIHGWGMAHEVWDRQILALASDYRCISVDLRGHGGSPKPSTGYDYDDHAADLTALIKRLGLVDPVLVGWSLGGAVATRAAARLRSIRGLVLVCAATKYVWAPDADYGRPLEECQAFLSNMRAARENVMWDVVKSSLLRDPGEPVRQWLYGLSLKLPSWAAAGCFEGVIRGDVRADLRSLTVPVLVLHGTFDSFISIESTRWITELPNARVVEFTESAHTPFLEETERFNNELRSFLTTNPSTS